MAMDGATLGQEILDAVVAAIDPIDKDPETNPDFGDEIKEAMWKAVGETIVAHIQTNAVVPDLVQHVIDNTDGRVE